MTNRGGTTSTTTTSPIEKFISLPALFFCVLPSLGRRRRRRKEEFCAGREAMTSMARINTRSAAGVAAAAWPGITICLYAHARSLSFLTCTDIQLSHPPPLSDWTGRQQTMRLARHAAPPSGRRMALFASFPGRQNKTKISLLLLLVDPSILPRVVFFSQSCLSGPHFHPIAY